MGIGEAVARAAARRGARLILASRNTERLKQIQDELSASAAGIEVIATDLSQAADAERLAKTVAERYPQLDGIVLNAGVGLYGEFAEVSDADIRELFEINFFSNLSLIRGLLPSLRQAAAPRIALVSSVVGWRGLPRLSTYCASKGALNLFAEALRVELKKSGITLSNIYPGRTRTQFQANAKTEGWKPPDNWGQSAESVAEKILKAMRRGKRDEFISLSNRLVIWGNFLFPKLIDYFLERYFRDK